MNFDQALEHCRAFVTKSRKTLAERREEWRNLNPISRLTSHGDKEPLFDETEGIIDCLEFLLLNVEK
jgi:hypothetical protein